MAAVQVVVTLCQHHPVVGRRPKRHVKLLKHAHLRYENVASRSFACSCNFCATNAHRHAAASVWSDQQESEQESEMIFSK